MFHDKARIHVQAGRGGDEPAPSESGESADDDSEWGYVPMSEWESDITPDSRSR